MPQRKWDVVFLRDGKPIFGFRADVWPNRKQLEDEARDRWGVDEVQITRIEEDSDGRTS